MSYTHLLARAVPNYSSTETGTRRNAIVIALVFGIFAIGIGMVFLIRRTNRSKARDPESNITHSQRLRREHDGRWGPPPAPVETAAERRRRNLQVRANRTQECGAGHEARRQRETRERDEAPPSYQLPAPAYFASPELRRQCLGGQGQTQIPPLVGDMPPAYESAAVWPART